MMFWFVVVAISLIIVFMNWASHELHKRTKVPAIKSWKSNMEEDCESTEIIKQENFGGPW